jgi:hypothetical protein
MRCQHKIENIKDIADKIQRKDQFYTEKDSLDQIYLCADCEIDFRNSKSFENIEFTGVVISSS